MQENKGLILANLYRYSSVLPQLDEGDQANRLASRGPGRHER
jgi:hypothetical protein